MKKIITTVSLMLISLLCFFSFTACNEPNYTTKDCFEVVQEHSLLTTTCTIDDVLGDEPTAFENGNYSLKTKKALKITTISYDAFTGYVYEKIVITDNSILKEYKVGEFINLENYRTSEMHNLVIEFKVL
ncbi:MAG: hypothetical protein IJY57_00515 [Clostridia bacterium]|nr:hypothetical protein [Clostridia bacterium]